MIDFDELEYALGRMKPRQKLYNLVKSEMKKRGNWKDKPRGKILPKGSDPFRERQR